MALEINVHLDASEKLCFAFNNLANTISAVMLTAIEQQDKAGQVLQEASQTAQAQVAAPHGNEFGRPVKDIDMPADPPAAPAPEPEKPATDYKALRAELKSIMAKAAKDGKTDAVKALLHELGVTKLSQIPDDKVETALKKAGDI